MFRGVQDSLYLCIVATILSRFSCNAAQPFKHIGCYNDDHNPERALPEYFGDFSRDHVIKQCAFAASNKGYNTFGIQYGGWSGYSCYSGPNADQTYMKHGKSTNCGSDGIGDSWANDVYQFTDEILWPEGTYSLLKPSSGCASQLMDNGFVLQDTVDNVNNNRSSVLHMDGYVARSYVLRWFCTKTKRTSPEWPEGQYCVYKEGSTTPTGMRYGWITMDTDGKNGNSALSLKYENGIQKSRYDLYIYFFCKTTRAKSQPIDLPITHPFYLLPYGSAECQQVKWMVATSEWIQYGTLNYQAQTGWMVPFIEAGSESHRGLTMFYCFYESCNKTLTDMKGTLQSPRFPDKYPDGQLCSWKIRVPANHTIHVYFTTFSLAVENGTDTDVLENYRSKNDSLELVQAYRGSLESFKVNSTSDLMFVFRSNQANSSSGFNAEYHFILDEEPTTEFTTGSPTIEPTTGSPTTTYVPTEIQSSIQQSSRPTTAAFKSNDSSRNSLKDNREGTGTTILIVIPLVCFILVVVVTIDIIYRCRSNSRLKAQKDDQRNYNHDDDQVADNPTYGKRSVTIPMTHFNSTTIVNTTAGQTDEDNDQSYDRLSRNILPKHDVPEQYGQLNRAAQPIKTDHESRVSLQNNGPVYQTLEGPDSEPVVDDQMYHTIDEKPSSNDLYERNILYDSVA